MTPGTHGKVYGRPKEFCLLYILNIFGNPFKKSAKFIVFIFKKNCDFKQKYFNAKIRGFLL